MTGASETARVRRIQDKTAPKYDRQMGVFDRVLFAGGREWACSRADGKVLEIAVGTGRNLACHRDDGRPREPLEHVEAEGFEITEQERSKWGIVERIAARKSK